MSAQKVGLKKIAELAGVDVSTVSRSLSGSERVSEETRKAVQKIADELCYKPNGFARGLVVGKSLSVGVILPEIINSFYAGVISSLEKVFTEAGYSIILGLSHSDAETELKCVKLFETKMVDGMILFSGNMKGKKGSYSDVKIPIVVMDYTEDAQNVDVVATNHIMGVKMGLDYLSGLGHKRIAFVTDDVTTSERMNTFKTYSHDLGFNNDDYIVLSTVRYEKGGYEAVRELFGKETRPTAVFCANDYMAIGAMKALNDMNLRVPEDVSVMGFDDAVLLNYLNCPLTTICQHKDMLGEEAGRLLLNRMKSSTEAKDASPLMNIIIRPELVVRESTGPCKESKN